MSELSKLQSQHKNLTGKMGKVQEEIHTKSLEFGLLSHTSKSDPAYSSTKLENLRADLKRLNEQRDDLRVGLDDCDLRIRLASIPHTPEQQAAMTTQAAKDERREALQADLVRTREALKARRGSMGQEIVSGADPAMVVEEVEFLERLERGLVAGLEACK
jgi:hypothetical protein